MRARHPCGWHGGRGGGPGAGKSTGGRLLTDRHHYATDDVMADHAARTTRAARDRMFTERLRAETARLHPRTIRVDTALTEDELTAQVLAAFRGALASGPG
ncbi:hypothetical protein ABZ646_36720 [Streptomyces sp. NPDC007162]|uniref:hypothetical protein n=1 Tax=Streptomyces sp. NPDC007162 TaxID=3156917 RepID=UPI0033FC990F